MWPVGTTAASAPALGSTEAVGEVMFRDYVLPFEVVSFLLLAALIGAIVLARKDEGATDVIRLPLILLFSALPVLVRRLRGARAAERRHGADGDRADAERRQPEPGRRSRPSCTTCPGQIFALFVIAVAAAEVGIGLAIVILLFRNRASINVDEVDLLKW